MNCNFSGLYVYRAAHTVTYRAARTVTYRAAHTVTYPLLSQITKFTLSHFTMLGFWLCQFNTGSLDCGLCLSSSAEFLVWWFQFNICSLGYI